MYIPAPRALRGGRPLAPAGSPRLPAEARDVMIAMQEWRVVTAGALRLGLLAVPASVVVKRAPWLRTGFIYTIGITAAYWSIERLVSLLQHT